MTQHIWHKEIKAWADGAEIEFSYSEKNGVDVWMEAAAPLWNYGEDYIYRIKPQPKKPIKLFVIEYIDNKSVRLSTDGFYTTKLEKMIGKIEVQDE